MRWRAAGPGNAWTIALHRYPEEADEAECPVYASWVARALERGVYLGFLAFTEEGGVVAGAGLTLLEWGPSRGDPQPYRARLVNVWTHPDWRRQGLAREAVTACLEAARQRGVTRLSLGTSVMARGLYARLGFEASATEMTLVL
ncbi:GNAT family N-acetyltransferase [Deinococcus malanensis]|uniref:GNAT family N-acetyltransferase n=1 Tax=Deinococcus malanensis TaxID=1706855 RepID=A0ABQ2F0Y6_9DEIO|nr:GNAT family N-acetyltransferase [Deinococcus malanensis]GGK30645.1 GNAT family N-acetyltransferase [Deinococcus malanensis]